MRVRLVFAIVCAIALSAAASPKPAWKQVMPLGKHRATTVASGGVSVTVTPPPMAPEDREISDEEWDATYSKPTVTIRFPGQPNFVLPEDEARNDAYGISVGVGPMAPGEAPTVLFAGYSGGMHCCATLQTVTLVDGKPVVSTMPMIDGEQTTKFPKDIDGDGVRDIVWQDDSLLYAFTSHAGSWQIPRIWNLRDGKPVDVSREPRYAPTYRKFASQALKACRARQIGRNGACAAYAHAMAILGQAEQGILTAVSLAEPSTWLPESCTVPTDDGVCPEGKERTFASFEEALRWTMQANGYR